MLQLPSLTRHQKQTTAEEQQHHDKSKEGQEKAPPIAVDQASARKLALARQLVSAAFNSSHKLGSDSSGAGTSRPYPHLPTGNDLTYVVVADPSNKTVYNLDKERAFISELNLQRVVDETRRQAEYPSSSVK